ncbi:acetoin reductase family protein [Epithele typhae]|uniref:acetoin reductase family protein n=1 Tax=Epithele typhae TaxID=378194 RepID=UPI0020089FF6|nr:acetoin reductase family protein [Epithele typhae]KAH9919208.1 acetoin reductase family protein [Epithele typhae]
MSTTPAKRVAIITGAAEGIGRGIALRLAKDGFDLGVTSAHGSKVCIVLGDVSIEDDVRMLVETVVSELGGLYAMIANAGLGGTLCILHETPNEVLDKLINVHIKGTFFSYKYAAMQMIKQGIGGRIVGAASIASKKGVPDQAIYTATKFAVRGLTQSAAMDYAKYGINVNAYAPGAIDTKLLDALDEVQTARTGTPRGTFASSFPNLLGRNGRPEDVAKLVSFLVSDDSSFITGQSYLIDGGYCFD